MSSEIRPNLLRPRWSKVLSDLRDNKMRTLLVVASIAVGVFSMGMIVSAYIILDADIDSSYASAAPVNIEVRTDPFFEDFVRARVTEGLSVSASAKVAVSVPCQVSPTTVPTNASTGYANSGSEFVQSVTISNTCEEPWIVIRTRNTGASPDVVLSLDGYFNPGTGRISWNCHMVRGDKQYLPGSCRGGHL